MHRVFATVGLIVGGVAGLLTVGAAVIEAGGGGHGQCYPTPRDGQDEPVVIAGTCFEPAVLYIEPGNTVVWQQRDVIPHNVTFFGGELLGDRLEMRKGDEVSRTFSQAGVFPFYCSIHPSMIGAVVVGDAESPGFGATLEVQTTAAELRAIADYKQEWFANLPDEIRPPDQGVPGSGKGAAGEAGGSWREAAIGFGLAGGLVVGLVAVGGGMKFARRRR